MSQYKPIRNTRSIVLVYSGMSSFCDDYLIYIPLEMLQSDNKHIGLGNNVTTRHTDIFGKYSPICHIGAWL